MGDNEREGVVEVCYDGVWGTICDDTIAPRGGSDSRAEVICRQLGFLEPNTSKQGFA